LQLITCWRIVTQYGKKIYRFIAFLLKQYNDSSNDGLILKLEKKRTQQQWELTVKNLTEYGPGIPQETVYYKCKW